MGPETPNAVEVLNVTRRFGDIVALDHVSLSIRQGEFFSLLGPSGCGKTTLLRVIAGLETPDAGALKIGVEDATHTPAHRRPVNTVFQSYALFPHLTVWQNIAFGLKMKHVPRGEMEHRVKAACELVHLQSLGNRRPNQLSGGQKQRVALARALVNEPQVLLLDEPLSALDVQLRKQLQDELRNLQHRLGITFIYVTHDQEEAFMLSDRIAVMHYGAILQTGTPRDLYERPRNRFTCQFVGNSSLLEATVLQGSAGEGQVQTEAGLLRIADTPPGAGRVTLAIRPEKVELFPLREPVGENSVPVVVEEVVYAGARTFYLLRAGKVVLRAETVNNTAGTRTFAAGQAALARLPADALVRLED